MTKVIICLHFCHRVCQIVLTDDDGSRRGKVLPPICLCVCLFFYTKSRKPVQLGSPNFTLKCSAMSPENPFIWVNRSRVTENIAGVGWLLHSCECWLYQFLSVVEGSLSVLMHASMLQCSHPLWMGMKLGYANLCRFTPQIVYHNNVPWAVLTWRLVQYILRWLVYKGTIKKKKVTSARLIAFQHVRGRPRGA